MLVLTRKKGQSIIIGDDIEISITDIQGDQIKLGINAPKNVTIHRKEVFLEIQQENIKASDLGILQSGQANCGLDELSKKLMKKDEEEHKKPSSLKASENEKIKGSNKKSESSNVQSKSPNIKSGNSIKKSRNSNKKSGDSNKNSGNPNSQSENSSLPKLETPETKEAVRSARERKANAKERKLPKKYKKGW